MKFILLFASFLLLTGCWNRVELNEIAIISATGVDWQDGKWVMSYQIVIPKAISSGTSGSGTAAVNVFSTEGENFRMAISKASEESARRLYFSHNQVVIISQEAARKGIAPLLEAYLRNHDSRETVSVFLSKGNARKMLEQLIPPEQIPGAAVQRMITNEETGSAAFRQMTIHSVLKELLSNTKATGIPGLVLAGSGKSTDSVDEMGKTSTPSKVRLNELGLIHGDKLVGWLNDDQSRGVMWLSDNVDKTTVSYSCAENKVGPDGSSVRIMKASTKIQSVPMNNKWKMKVKIEAKGVLMEYSCHHDLTKPKEVERVERKIEEEIKAIALGGWKSVRKYKTDIMGFGNIIHEQHPKLWKESSGNWDELFPLTELEISVKMKVESTGMSGRNFKAAQEKAGS
ncbi:Ger(x)C family spore germination protein [Paenibacillus sp. GSMTC-2017]|uniref:Ger(x)C family spore germination protein n=1 Tax=Paenibacillus sp. GSMTC-2017 TaxID=2794350 RepID=UPI0018D761CD|nr:Ger(x)C family spore germination protein [Paenibacillus sp. GSMTC-2017]MBH5316733.1 Ger(x)C family spore germination protein [Paenibacillus sp. GSMTC-2017]